MNSPFWNWASANIIHARLMAGLNSRRWKYAFCLADILPLGFLGLRLMLCFLMAFSAFSIALSKLLLPRPAVLVLATMYIGSISV